MFWSKRRAEKQAEQRAHSQAELRAAVVEMLQLVGGGPGAGDDSPLILRHGERFVCHLKGGLFEPRRGAGHWSGGSAGFSIPVADGIRFRVGRTRGHFVQGAEQATVVDHGDVTVTTERVVFQGGKYTREWSFDKLLGVMHFSDAPWTAIQVSNRQKTSGVSYDGVPPVLFRLRLAVAIALFEGEAKEASDLLHQQLADIDAGSAASAAAAGPATPAVTVPGDAHPPIEPPADRTPGAGSPAEEPALSRPTLPAAAQAAMPATNGPGEAPPPPERPAESVAGRPGAQEEAPATTGTDAARPPAPVPEGPPPLAPPTWAPDPSGRHQFRYWDGRSWTDHVSDGGQTSTDPVR